MAQSNAASTSCDTGSRSTATSPTECSTRGSTSGPVRMSDIGPCPVRKYSGITLVMPIRCTLAHKLITELVSRVGVGLAFKLSAVPFQMWTPDAYEAAPPAVTGFMSTGVKAAAFAAFVRVFLAAFYPLRSEWSGIVMVVAAATMIVGTVVGVAQSNVKRMLAY